jgi:hypothetical protein
MRVRTLSLALLLTCPTVLADKIKHEFDKQAPFASFKTYAFKPGLNTVSTNREQMDSFVFNSTRRELEARGMQEVKERPDIYLTYFLNLEGLAASGSLNAPGLQSRYDYGIPSGLSSVSSSVAMKGTLLLEMVNAATNQLA